jgi:hypothetical protein
MPPVARETALQGFGMPNAVKGAMVLLGASLVAACGARTSLPSSDDSPLVADAGVVDAAQDAIADAAHDGSREAEPFDAGPPPEICTPPEGGVALTTCQRSLVVTSLLRSNPRCFVDAVVAVGQQGLLIYPCNADGPATITFGTRGFTGAYIGGVVDVCTGTTFPWSDGCQWTSAQRIVGPLASGALAFTYAEAPAQGQSACLRPCSAQGTLQLQ